MCVCSAPCERLLTERDPESAGRASDGVDVLPRAFLALHLLRAPHPRRPRDPACAGGERERDDQAGSSELDPRHTLLTWRTRCDAHEGAYSSLPVDLRLIVPVPAALLSLRQVTPRHLNRQSRRARLARYRKHGLGPGRTSPPLAYTPRTKG